MAVSDDISDLWWLRDRPAESQAGWALGVQMGQHQQQMRLAQQQRETLMALEAQRTLMSMSQLADVQARHRGMAEVSSYLSDVASAASKIQDPSKSPWRDPQVEAKIRSFGVRYPQLYTDNWLDNIIKNTVGNAQTAYDKWQASQETPVSKDLAQAERSRALAAQARAAGDTAGELQHLKNAATFESAHIAPSETTRITYDESGHPVVEVVKGPTTPQFGPTVAMKTKLQEKMSQNADAMATIDYLEGHLTESDFGLRGVAKELWAKLAGQVGIPIDVEDLQPRAALRTLQAAMIRQMRSDSNISQIEVNRLEQALPSLGALESYSDGIAKIASSKRMIVGAERRAAETLGVLAKPWALSAKEIIDAWNAGKAAIKTGMKASDPEFKAKYLTDSQAWQYLNTYFPDIAGRVTGQ